MSSLSGTGGTMKRLVLLTLAVLLCGPPGHSKAVFQNSEVPLAVAALDESFVEAVSKADRSNLAAILDGDFSWTSTNGEVLGRNELLATIPTSAGLSQGSREFRILSKDVVGVLTQQGQFHTLRIWVKRQSGWRILAYHAVDQLTSPPATHGGQTECYNPCKSLPYDAKDPAEAGVIASWQALESDVTAHDSAGWATHVSDDFIQISSNSDRVLDKSTRMKIIAAQKASGTGAAPPPLASARFDDLGDVLVMHALNHPLTGKPILVTRIWIKRMDRWIMSVSFQTTIQIQPDAVR
jgi:Domain of unknown function (DUF4440)